MDNEQLTFGNNDPLSTSRSEFISVNIDQDSLSFYAKSAGYSLKDFIIYAEGVDSILVADAIIFPDSAKLTVARNAKIQTLNNSRITLDSLVRYHNFNNASVDIIGKNNYSASGDYVYKDALENEQPIYFSEISVASLRIAVLRSLSTTFRSLSVGAF